MASTYTKQDVMNEVYKILDEYSTTTASVDVNLTNRIGTLINHYYFELAERDKDGIKVQTRISQYPVENMLGETFYYDVNTPTATSVFSMASAYSYYFEVDGDFTLDVKDGSNTTTMVTLATISGSGISSFTQYAGFATAAVSSDYITLDFYGGNVYTIKNVAFYPYTFNNTTASVPYYRPECEYALSSDYDKMDNISYRYKDAVGIFGDYRIENDKLYIPRGYSAEFMFNYYKIVTPVTSVASSFEMKDKTVLLIPYAVAGDILIGNGYNLQAGKILKEEYEIKKAQINPYRYLGKTEITNAKSW